MPAISKVQICNMALSNIGAGTIESIDEQSAGAKQCKVWYDHSRIQALEQYNWNFARKRVALALSTEDPPADGKWGFRFLYPSDCLVAREIENPNGPDADAVPFAVEMTDDGQLKTILTNYDTPTLIYTFDQQSTALFNRYFCETLAFLLGSHIGYALTKKREIKSEQFELYRYMIRNASAVNANESVDDKPREAETIRARA